MPSVQPTSSRDWVARTADAVAETAEQRAPGTPIVCASGLSPSGPIHLGNLRELTTQHLVAEELRRRGLACRHLLFWDDYDRLRKVPAGVSAAYADHLGRPLSAVPDPWGELPSWAERFAAPVRGALERLGIDVEEISQTERYAAGHYTEPILTAMRERRRIAELLGRDGEFAPYRVYCESCGRDTTSITAYDDATTRLDYRCDECGHIGGFVLADGGSGKLVFRVDWPMRWAHEPVLFEAAGVDHSDPGSTATVGFRLCREIFGAEPPVYLGYAFVGAQGVTKLSSSAGGAPSLDDGLRVIEAPVLRWVYERRQPRQPFTVDLGDELTRLYDEWDRLTARVDSGAGSERDRASVERARRTQATRPLPTPRRPVPWRLLTSVLDLTAGDDEQLLRVLRSAEPAYADLTLADLEPRLARARAWVAGRPDEVRTRVRAEPDTDLLGELGPAGRRGIEILVSRLGDDWSLDGLTRLVYGVPKLLRGLPMDAAPTPELKRAQRAFFALLYRLIVDRDTGPRLPTLLLAVGPDRLRTLLCKAAWP